MDYVKCYNKICEAHSTQTDILNFMDNRVEEILKQDYDNDLMQRAEDVRNKIDRLKEVQIKFLKVLHETEIAMELMKK